jgi:hypothetical protein
MANAQRQAENAIIAWLSKYDYLENNLAAPENICLKYSSDVASFYTAPRVYRQLCFVVVLLARSTS